MSRRFTPELLHALRNQVPITRLIRDSLNLPSRRIGDKLRYECPKCGGFDTSILIDHNILRCFDCRQNRNPIEMVMDCLKLDFVKSVNWLLQHHPLHLYDKSPVLHSNPGQVEPIGQVLNRVMPTLPDKQITDDNPPEILDRVIVLESKVDQIMTNIADLKEMMMAQK